MKVSLILSGLIIAGIVVVSSCKKSSTTTPTKDSDVTAVNDNSTAEQHSNDAVNITAQAFENSNNQVNYRTGNGSQVFSIGCATATLDAPNHKITVNFSGGVCLDGHIRTGALILDYSAGAANNAYYYRSAGFRCKITSQAYTVDNYTVNINKTITNTTGQASTNLSWADTSAISVVKPNNGGTITWNCARTQTLLNTQNVTFNGQVDSAAYVNATTPIKWAKALIGITGSANGVTAAGETYSFVITNQLVLDMQCSPSSLYPAHHPFIQGSFDFTPGAKATRHIDYGNGSCDLNATVTISGISIAITLP